MAADSQYVLSPGMLKRKTFWLTPVCSVQWEDWSTTMAFDLLDDYREKIPSFNDDVSRFCVRVTLEIMC
jgi:hypothetical protein